jgi:hypothetical protein
LRNKPTAGLPCRQFQVYSGECKKGLAHGKGIAQGIDHYEGQGKFVSGDTVVTGFWKENQYQGKVQRPPYIITLNRNVTRYTMTKSVGVDTDIRIKLMLGGGENTEVENFSIASDSGSEYRNTGIYGIQNSSVPLFVKVSYRSWNQMHTALYDVMFEFTINDPGNWNITLTNM